MAEGTHIPGTTSCVEWEAQLTDALDGLLSPGEEARFAAHKLICPACAEMHEEARKGREWLEFLSPEPEAPEGLLERILAATGPGQVANGMPAAAGAVPAFLPPVCHPTDVDLSVGTPVWQQPGFMERMRQNVHPRMLMTVAMAFFSIALTLNLVGADIGHLRLSDLRPRMMRSYMERQLNMASVPIVRYYDHLRFVHEVEARVRELQSQNESEDNSGEQPQQQTQPAGPGETRYNRDRGTKRTGAGEFLETSLEFPMGPVQGGGQSGCYMVRTSERSTSWTA